MIRIARWSWLLLVAIPLTASCARVNSIKWTEDVLLPDGRTVTLSRYEEFGGRYEPGQSPTTSAWGFEFLHPVSGQTVRFRGNHFFFPLGMFVWNAETYLVLRPWLGGSIFLEGCPKPSYVFAKHSTDSWKRVPYSDVPLRQLTQNMLHGATSYQAKIQERQFRLGVDFLQASGRPVDGLTRIDVSQIDRPLLACPERQKPLPIEAPGGAK